MGARMRQSNTLNGWLVSQNENCCYHFHSDAKSVNLYKFVLVDRWSMKRNGTLLKLKSRSKLPLDDALELCGQMLLDGWGKLNHKLNLIKEVDTPNEVAV